MCLFLNYTFAVMSLWNCDRSAIISWHRTSVSRGKVYRTWSVHWTAVVYTTSVLPCVVHTNDLSCLLSSIRPNHSLCRWI